MNNKEGFEHLRSTLISRFSKTAMLLLTDGCGISLLDIDLKHYDNEYCGQLIRTLVTQLYSSTGTDLKEVKEELQKYSKPVRITYGRKYVLTSSDAVILTRTTKKILGELC